MFLWKYYAAKSCGTAILLNNTQVWASVGYLHLENLLVLSHVRALTLQLQAVAMGEQRQRQHLCRAVLRDEAGGGDYGVVGVAADGVGGVVPVLCGQNRGDVPNVRTPGVACHVQLSLLHRCERLQTKRALAGLAKCSFDAQECLTRGWEYQD